MKGLVEVLVLIQKNRFNDYFLSHHYFKKKISEKLQYISTTANIPDTIEKLEAEIKLLENLILESDQEMNEYIRQVI